RSERSSNSATDDATKTMMGATQKTWFKQALLDADTAGAELILWMSSSVWNGYGVTSTAGWHDDDTWAAFTTERQEIADHIATNGLGSKVFVLTGDAHAMAHDDGTHGDFSTTNAAPVKTFMAAPMDRSAIVRGDNWTHGVYAAAGQYGLFDFTDDGDTIT